MGKPPILKGPQNPGTKENLLYFHLFLEKRAKPPTFLDGSKAPRGRPDPQNDRLSIKSLNPNPPPPIDPSKGPYRPLKKGPHRSAADQGQASAPQKDQAGAVTGPGPDRAAPDPRLGANRAPIGPQ